MRYLPVAHRHRASHGSSCFIQPIAIDYCIWQRMTVQSPRVYRTYI